MTTPIELQRRYPYMFSGPHIGLDIARGWMPAFEKLCADIDDLGGKELGFYWRQLKEKFGQPRFYKAFSIKRPTAVQKIAMAKITSLVIAVQDEMMGCIVDGSEPAELHGSYVLMLCPHHIRQREHDPETMDQIWFSDDEGFQ